MNSAITEPAPAAHSTSHDDHFVLANEYLEVRSAKASLPGASADNPLLAIRRKTGHTQWITASYTGAVEKMEARIVENGPLRLACETRLELPSGGAYRLRVELEAGHHWIRLSESFHGGRTDRGEVPNLMVDLADFKARHLIFDGCPGTVAMYHDARTFRASFGVNPDNLVSLGAQTVFGQVGAPWLLLDDGATAFGVVTIGGGDWAFPGDATLHLHRAAQGLELVGECDRGSRQWLLLLGSSADWMPRQGEAATALAQLKKSRGDLPLEKTRHWVLDLDEKAAADAAPRLWTDGDGLAEARLRLQCPEWAGLLESVSHIELEARAYQEDESRCFGLQGTTDSFPVGLRWLQFDDHAAGRELARQIGDWVEERAARFAAAGFLGAGLDVVALRPLKHCLYWYDLLRGSGLMNVEEAARIRRALLFCAYCLYDRDYFDWQSAYAPGGSEHSLRRFLLEEDYSDTMGCQNFHADIFTYLAAIGLVFPGHAMADEWVAHGEAMAFASLECYVAPDGTYVESDNYYQHFLGLIYYLGFALHRAGRPALLEHPRLKAGLEYWGHARTPPLLHTGSPGTTWFGVYCAQPRQRPLVLMPPLGDCGLNWGGQCMPTFLHHAANFYAAHDAPLAGALEWTWQRAGKPLAQYNFVVQEVVTQQLQGPPPRALTLRSRELRGHGFLMRADVDGPRESALLVSCGRATSHMHWDAGSLLLWHAGTPVIVDPGYIHGEFTPHREYGGASWKHSTVTFACGDAREGWPDNGYLGMEHRQPPRAVIAGDDFDYLECDLSQNNCRGRNWRDVRRIVSIEHYRQVLFAKNRYIVVKDRIFRSIYPATWHLWLFGEAEVEGNRVRGKGPFGVDLCATFVQPEQAAIHTQRYGAARHVWTQQAPERDFLVVLKPLLALEEPYDVAIEDGWVTISGPDWVDRVWLDPLPDLGAAEHRQPSSPDPTKQPERGAGSRCAVQRNGHIQIIHH